MTIDPEASNSLDPWTDGVPLHGQDSRKRTFACDPADSMGACRKLIKPGKFLSALMTGYSVSGIKTFTDFIDRYYGSEAELDYKVVSRAVDTNNTALPPGPGTGDMSPALSRARDNTTMYCFFGVRASQTASHIYSKEAGSSQRGVLDQIVSWRLNKLT